MNDALLKLAIPVLLGSGALFTLILSLIFNVSGTWEREAEDGSATGERITLGQLGPFVRGRRAIPGGWQEFAGTMWGRTLRLQRRDFGVAALVRANFPDPIARKLDGEVFAELKLTLTDQGTHLSGTFIPQRISFDLAPPKITGRGWLPPVPRAYRRVSREHLAAEARG